MVVDEEYYPGPNEVYDDYFDFTPNSDSRVVGLTEKGRLIWGRASKRSTFRIEDARWEPDDT